MDHVGWNSLDMSLVVMLRVLFFSHQSVFSSVAPSASGEPVTRAGLGAGYHSQDRMKCSGGCNAGRMSEESTGSSDAVGMNGRRVDRQSSRSEGEGRSAQVGLAEGADLC